ncbi:MAG: flagellar biosynthetic protein FliR [gamma proteobacterium symbiont of Ctena orbiculata]|nr:MAG: flagellar biosynthetic protein FliR [gamma proteobacterium symbiont of Ctena orbiculata]
MFAITRVPARVRVLFVLALSAVLTAGIGVLPIDPPATLSGLMHAMVNELILGMILAFGLFTAFGAFLFGGRIIDFQMGFGVANLIDPATQSQAPMLGTVLNLMAVMTFFLLDGHHLLIRGLVYSLQKIPPGSSLHEVDVQAIIAQFGVMFVYGLAVVAPVVAVLLMLDVGMAVAARTMPQVNMFIVGFPLKIFMGLLVLALSLNYMGPLLEKIYASIFIYWQRVYG